MRISVRFTSDECVPEKGEHDAAAVALYLVFCDGRQDVTSNSFRDEFAPHLVRDSRTTPSPKNSRASYSLCAWHRSWMFATVASPPAAYGSTWWNSRNAVSRQRPSRPTNAQRPASRRQTSRRTAAGMWRVRPVPAGPGAAADPHRRDVSAKRRRSSALASAVIARSKISAASPDGTAWRRSAWTRRNLSWVSRETVS